MAMDPRSRRRRRHARREARRARREAEMRGPRLPGKLTAHMYTRDAIQAGMDSSPAASRAGVWIGALFVLGTVASIVASSLGWV